ncbi:hypothetical protein JCM8202v2_002858 [Rhodotorula sphaerocarpa]
MIKFADALGLHRSATFNATVTIHELTQVPLLNAKFCIKWKFKGATLSSHTGADKDGANTDDAASKHSEHPPQQQQPTEKHSQTHEKPTHRFGQGRASRWLHPRSALASSTSVNSLSSSSSHPHKNGAERQRTRSSSGSGSRFDRSSTDDDEPDAPGSPSQASTSLSPVVGGRSDPGASPSSNRGLGQSYANAFGTGLGERNVEALYAGSAPSPAQETGGRSGSRKRSSAGGSSGDAANVTSPISLTETTPTTTALGPEPRGKTQTVPLRSHTATFNREVTCPVSISLRHAADSKKYQLQPSPVRLSIRQQVTGEDHKVGEEKLGEVVLDLSQFVPRHGKRSEQGKPRRYLLQGCKSNTVIRVSVKMDWLDGAHDFVAPPLKSGQMTNSSSGLKGLASLHNSPANRSTTSLAKGSQNHNGGSRLSATDSPRNGSNNVSRNMSRSNSVSSHLSHLSSAHSTARSTPSPERQRAHRPKPKRKTWHPPYSAVSNATAPMALGGWGTGQANDQRTPAEIIDMLFNRPVSPDGASGSGRNPRPAAEEQLGGRPGPSRESSAQTETGTVRGSRFSLARKAWSTRSSRSAAKTPAKEPAEFDRDLPEVPTAASYAQTEAPDELRRPQERDAMLRDRTYDFRTPHMDESPTKLGKTLHGGTTYPPVAKPKLAIRTSASMRRTASHSTSSETETGTQTQSQKGPQLGPVRPAAARRPSLPHSASSRPVSIRWNDEKPPTPSRHSTHSLASPMPKSKSGPELGQRREKAGTETSSSHSRETAAPAFASLVTPPSPSQRDRDKTPTR